MKVITKDFQSLKGTNEFEFPVGITIIQGKTDSGKSTVFYAIEDCLANPSGVADIINWDAKQAEVTIDNEDNKVTWIKTNSSCEYIDKEGKSYVKASKIDSRNFGNLGFYFDKKDKIVNIHSEWDKLFPFEASDSEMFKLFEDIFNISCSFQIVDLMKKDEQSKKQQINEITSRMNQLTIDNNSIEQILNSININDLNNLNEKLNNSKLLIDEMNNDYQIYFHNLSKQNLPMIESFDNSKLINSLNQLNEMINDFELYQNVNNYPELPEIKTFNLSVNPIFEDYHVYSQNIDNLLNYEKEIDSLNMQYEQLMNKKKEIKVCPTCGHSLE